MDKHLLPAGSNLQNGKYCIHSVLGQGGFGITYEGEQIGLGMKVAIKEFFLKGFCMRDVSTSCVKIPVEDNKVLVNRCLKKFKSEARKIASLKNDHIINIIDVFDENGTSYYVMKYLEGGSLAGRLQSGPLTEKEALKVIRDISNALRSVHSNGLLHLDIKPANILYDECGRAVLIDFGSSKYLDSVTDSTTTSSLIGFSRGYAPLEQVNSTLSSLSPATDIYALGATMYSLLSGEAPPEASLVMDTEIPPLPADVSDETKNAVRQAMQPNRKDRPQSIDAFLELLPQDEVPSYSEDTMILVQQNVPEVVDAETPHRFGRISLIVSSFMLAVSLVLAGMTFLGFPRKEGGSNGAVEVSDLNKEVARLTKANADLQSEIDRIRRDASKNNGTSTALQDQVKSMQRQIDDLKSRVNILTQANDVLQRDNTDLEAKVNSLTQANSKLQSDNTDLRSKNRVLQDSKEKLESTIKSLNRDIRELQLEIEDLRRID